MYTEVFFCAINLFGSDVKKRAKKVIKFVPKINFFKAKFERFPTTKMKKMHDVSSM